MEIVRIAFLKEMLGPYKNSWFPYHKIRKPKSNELDQGIEQFHFLDIQAGCLSGGHIVNEKWNGFCNQGL